MTLARTRPQMSMERELYKALPLSSSSPLLVAYNLPVFLATCDCMVIKLNKPTVKKKQATTPNTVDIVLSLPASASTFKADLW